MVAGWDPASPYPKPPINGQVVPAYELGILDLRWDDPSLLVENTAYTIIGINLYRSDVSDLGPYYRINPYPLGATYYRDETDHRFISQEVVEWRSAWRSQGHTANNRDWIFKTAKPIVKPKAYAPFSRPTPANSPFDLTVRIDGKQAAVAGVFGPNGEVTLVNQSYMDPITLKPVLPVLPTEGSEVTVSYHVSDNQVRSGLDSKLFYRITTVALDPNDPTQLVETPLTECQPYTVIAVETLDYIWREAIRRNNWILEQGGERIKAFIRRQSGIPCHCTLDEHLVAYSKQPSNRCIQCYGTGFLGGYEGPYEMIVAPDDAERRVSQGQWGRRLEHSYEVWTGPSPLVTQRDFVVKQTNERYSIGAVRRPNNRGNVLQQHFNVAYLDEGDVRYKVPINGIPELPWPQTRQERDPSVPYPIIGTQYAPLGVGPHAATPMGTDKDGIPEERQQRGRTPVWENQNY